MPQVMDSTDRNSFPSDTGIHTKAEGKTLLAQEPQDIIHRYLLLANTTCITTVTLGATKKVQQDFCGQKAVYTVCVTESSWKETQPCDNTVRKTVTDDRE